MGVAVIAWGAGLCVWGECCIYVYMCVCVGVVCLFDTHCQARAIKTARCIFICIIKLSCNANLIVPLASPYLSCLHCSNLTEFYPRSVLFTLFSILYLCRSLPSLVLSRLAFRRQLYALPTQQNFGLLVVVVVCSFREYL